MNWAATLFDGRSAMGRTVLLRVDGDALTIVARDALERHPIRDLALAEAFDHAPRMIGLPGGRTLEVPDPERTLDKALTDAGASTSWVVRMQSRWLAVVIALALLIGGAAWTYVEGVPVAARWIAQSLPPAWERTLGARVFALIDRNLEPSNLPPEDRSRISAQFREAAAVAAPGVETRVEFRAGGVNAFALPGGTIVVFDGLVELANDDDRVLGVLGHELGHVVAHHSMRQLLQAVGVGGIAGFLWGDFSTIAANVPVILGTMRYGREFEQEADRFSVEFMRKTNRPVAALHDMFVRLHKTQGRRSGDSVPEFLSTHPGTDARIDWLREEMAKEAGAAPEKAIDPRKSR